MIEDRDERARDLAEYANAGGQPIQPTQPPGGHALVRPTSGLAERVIGAQPVAVYRDEGRVLQKLTALAAAAGTDWFYRFPVNKKGGGVDYIEGPSIKLANDIARIFGNNVNEIRELDVGDAWVFYARFTDIETGFSMERAYRQRKSQTSMRTRDYDRQLDIAYQIGQSKAIRNCIVNSLQIYADHAFNAARNSLVEKIGKDIDAWRARTLEGLSKIPVDVGRAERAIGRAAKDWTAPHIAMVIAMMRSVADGMATIDETFPPIEPHETKTSDVSNNDGNVGASGGGEQAASKEGKASEPAVAADSLAAAYQRGKDAKANGVLSTRALPGEYRDAEHTREAIAWRAGFEGNPMPTFKDGEKPAEEKPA